MKTAFLVLLILVAVGGMFGTISAMGVRGELDNTKAQLADMETKWAATQNELTDTQGALSDVQAELKDNLAILDTTTQELSAAEQELSQAKYDLTDVTHQLDSSTAENTGLLDNYSALRQAVNLKAPNGEDGKIYVTPDDPVIGLKVEVVAGAYSENSNERWADYLRLYRWVVDNIEYSYDSKIPYLPSSLGGEINWYADYWRMPAETLTDKTGDCEDMAVLLASLLLNYSDHKIQFWLIEIQGFDSGHLAVAFPVKGGELAILDPAGNYYTGYQTGSLESYSITTTVNNWLAHWTDEMPGVAVTAIFSDDFYQEFDSTQEFIDWAKEN